MKAVTLVKFQGHSMNRGIAILSQEIYSIFVKSDSTKFYTRRSVLNPLVLGRSYSKIPRNLCLFV